MALLPLAPISPRNQRARLFDVKFDVVHDAAEIHRGLSGRDVVAQGALARVVQHVGPVLVAVGGSAAASRRRILETLHANDRIRGIGADACQITPGNAKLQDLLGDVLPAAGLVLHFDLDVAVDQ